MKKGIAAFMLLLCVHVQAQFVNQLVFKRQFTAHEIDSVLTAAVGISGIFPISYGAKAYKVIYNTVAADSTPTTASGLLIVPVGAPCKVPMLSYQHGTVTKKSDVPSRFQGEWFIALAGAGKGIVTLMPDYLGLGDGPGMHPYQHRMSEATSVVDLLRAAREVVDTLGSPVNEQLFLFGYSQGGHATMAAHQLLQEKFDNTMHVTASAPMSGAYDMSGVMADVMSSDSTYPSPYYLPYLIEGFNSVYHLYTNPADIYVAPYDTLLPPLFDGTRSGGYIDNRMPDVPKLVMQPYQMDSFINYPQTNFFRVKLRESDSYNWIPNSPVRMFYCRGDHSVPYQNTMVAYEKFRQNGTDMSLIDTIDVNPTLDHYPCAQFAILGGVNWFDSLTYKPLALSVSATATTSSTSPNGSATATPQLGDSPYTFAWSNGDTAATINNLGAGTYYVTITDQSMCTRTDSAVIQLTSGLQDEVLTNIRLYPNPAQGKVTIENANLQDNLLTPEVYDAAGRAVKTYAVPQGAGLQLYFDNAAPGVYFMHLRSAGGKETWRKLTLL